MSRAPFYFDPVSQTEFARVSGDAAQEGAWSKRLRTAASAFDLFMLPQDVFFNTLRVVSDRESSLVDVWNQMEWAKYAPFGETPERVTTGSDLLRIWGVEDEGAQKWGGIALDFLADPLLAGTWMGSVGRAAKIAGNVKTGDQLMRQGRRITDSMGLVPTTRSGQRVGALPSGAYDFVEQKFYDIANYAYNNPLPGFGRGQGTTLAAGLNILPESIQSRVGMAAATVSEATQAKGSRLTGKERLAAGREGMKKGDAIFKARQVADERVREARAFTTAQFDFINRELLGNDAPTFWSRVFGSVEQQWRSAKAAGGFTSGTQTVMWNEARRYADSAGPVFARKFNPTARQGGNTQVIRSFEDEVNDARRYAQQQIDEGTEEGAKYARALDESDRKFGEGIDKVRKAAAAVGDDPDKAEAAFRLMTENLVESSALQGHLLSFVEPIKKRFFESAAKSLRSNADSQGKIAGGSLDANDPDLIASLWSQLRSRGITQGLAGETLDMAEVTSFKYKGRDVSVADVFGKQNMAEVLQDNKMFNQLDLGQHLASLGSGHLRQTYNAFLDGESFASHIERMERGFLLPNNVLDEAGLVERMKRTGFRREVELMKEYMGVTNPQAGKAMNAEVFGSKAAEGMADSESTIVNTRDMLRHLIDRGVPKQRAQQFFDEMIADIKGGVTDGKVSSQRYSDFIKKAREKTMKYIDAGDQQGIPQATARFLGARQNLDRETLDALGGLANPLVALDQTADFTQRSMPLRESLQMLYDEAASNGLVRAADDVTVPNYVQLTSAHSGYGPFAGKRVHPFIAKQVNRVFKEPAFRIPPAIKKISNLIRGSLLAGPNILTANLAGGFYTTSLTGVNTFDHMAETARAFADLRRIARDPNVRIEDLDFLNTRISLGGTTLGDVAAGGDRQIAALQQALQEGVTSNNVQGLLDRMGFAARTFVDNPADVFVGPNGNQVAREIGQFFGLQGFTASEVAMKLGAYRAALKNGFTTEEAVEIARISTFDYSELPQMVEALRDTGLLMFPGFSYFIAGRTLGAVLGKQAGTVATANKIPDAIMNAQLSEEEKGALIGSMPEWLREDLGVPLTRRSVGAGNTTLGAIPLNQMLPLNVFYKGNLLDAVSPFTDSLSTLGIYQPFFEAAVGVIRGDGEAILSGQYGNKVFEPVGGFDQRLAQTMGFMYNSLAPNTVRKLVSYRPGAGMGGVAKALADSIVPLPDAFADSGYSRRDIDTDRVNRNLAEEAIGVALRSVQPVALSGPYASFERSYEGALYEFNQRRNILKERYERAVRNNNRQQMRRIILQDEQLQEEFLSQWRPYYDLVSRYRADQ